MHDVVFRGGTVVNARGTARQDVYVRRGTISAVTEPGVELPVHDVVDVSGRHLLPGILDGHAHFRTWSKHCDDLGDLTRSAAYGGITTIMPFVMGMNAEGTDLRSRVRACVAEGVEASPIDFGFHAAIADEGDTLAQLPELIDLGVTTFKMFMINRARKMMVDDGFLYRAMSEIAARGGIAMVHAELEDLSDALAASRAAADARDAHERFSIVRPAWLEAEATRRALEIAAATECPLYVVHVTCEAALDAIRAARSRGQTVYAETCPQYLGLTHDDERRLGGLAKVAPPLRSERDRAALTAAVISGDIDVVSSDHAPYEREVKANPSTPFEEIPVGMPGTETLLPVVWKILSEAGADIATLSRVLSSNPARIFGLASKGHVEAGRDADFTILDLESSSTIDGDALHSRAGYSAFDGWSAPLRVVASYQRGHAILENGRIPEAAPGEFLPRPQTDGGR
jgi:dihydropyrimidinase